MKRTTRCIAWLLAVCILAGGCTAAPPTKLPETTASEPEVHWESGYISTMEQEAAYGDAEGNGYRIHASNGDEALARKLRELPAGTELELLLHPEEDYVLGIYEDGTPILGWQAAQQEIEDEDLGFSWLGIAMWVLGIVMFATEKFSKKKK